MSEQDKPVVGPNTELYDQLAQPYPSRDEAESNIDAFIAGVQKLRAQLRIPEAIVVCATYFSPDNGGSKIAACKAFGMGHVEYRARLGALAFQAYTLPEIDHADELRSIAMGDTAKITHKV